MEIANLRWTAFKRCPVCDGCPADPRGQARRCIGFGSQDGRWAYCSREENAGSLPLDAKTDCYLHLMQGPCKCGQTHGEAVDTRQPDPSWTYHDATGNPIFEVVRYVRNGVKAYAQRRPGATGWGISGVRRELYRLPELLAAPISKPVFVVEGEKCVDACYRNGLIATTNSGGAGKWNQPNYSEALRGRDVVILPDADIDGPGPAHAEQVAASLDGIAKSVKVVPLPGLPDKGDIFDWFAAGKTVADLLLVVASSAPQEKNVQPLGWQAASERLHGGRESRLEVGSRVIQFGVPFLDDALCGISPHDLILLGAKTGLGKTSLATMIAQQACRQGKRVHYFALEARQREIEDRMLYQCIASLYYRDRPRRGIRFADWQIGRLDSLLHRFEREAEDTLREQVATLKTYYRAGQFTADDFAQHLATVGKETDLIILDHLHYVDTQNDNENRGQKEMMQRIEQAASEANRAVIVVAHVRKGDRRMDGLVPTVEDFHGSSDISKIATKAIVIGPAHGEVRDSPTAFPTYFHVPKHRADGSVSRFPAVLQFDATRDCYASQYRLGNFTDGGKVFSEIPIDDAPQWARDSASYVGPMAGAEEPRWSQQA